MTKCGQRTVATGIILGGALCAAVQAAPKPVQSVKPPHGVSAQAPDLACTIAVFRDAAGTVAVPPGGSVMSGGGVVFAFARVTVTNSSAIAKALNAATKLVSSSGAPNTVILPPVTLAAGASHSYPLQKFEYGALSANVTLTATVDPNNTVNESKEDNNACAFSFTEQTVH
jgi:hypothetical protein